MLDIEFAALSDCGQTRDHNEDYLGWIEPARSGADQGRGWLFALADGVGGQADGEIAARTAVEFLLEGFQKTGKAEPIRTILSRLVQAANTKVFEAGLAAKPGGVAMATTIVVCALRFDRVTVAHVGDSRCYLIRGRRATALTRDHTFVGEHARLGLLTNRAAGARHILTRSLGTNMFVAVETSEHILLSGDVLLLCSDGLHGAVSQDDITDAVCRNADLNAAARELIAAANKRDGNDNMSVQLIRIKSVESIGMYRGRPYKLVTPGTA
jgi:serine/threonine protein phosphatase PrpC